MIREPKNGPRSKRSMELSKSPRAAAPNPLSPSKAPRSYSMREIGVMTTPAAAPIAALRTKEKSTI